MLIEPSSRDEVDRSASKLRSAARVSAVLFAVLVTESPRLTTLKATGKTSRLDRLCASEAWIDAALELIALEAPEWSVQRLCLDDREWLCTLTRFPDLPDWLDDSAEGRHPVLALAIVGALLDIRARTAIASNVSGQQPAWVSADCTDYR